MRSLTSKAHYLFSLINGVNINSAVVIPLCTNVITRKITHYRSSLLLSKINLNRLLQVNQFSDVIPKTQHCWKCNKNIEAVCIFCPVCNCLLTLNEPVNYFEFMGLDIKFNIDTNQLKKKFLELQSQLHPDKYSTKEEKERIQSEKYSALTNKAYRTLLDPLDRGLYLLELMGLNKTPIHTDHHFLTEMMEFNEELENINSSNKLLQLETLNQKNLTSATRDVADAFASNDLQTAGLALAKMKFYYSNINRIKEMKQRRSIVD